MADKRYEDGILGLIPKEEWVDVGLNLTPAMVEDPADELLGDELTDNLVAKWHTIAEEYQTPTIAEFHGFDTEANKAFRIPVDTHSVEKGLIKEKMNMTERLRTLTRSGVQDQELYDYILNDGIRLARDVTMRTKVAKNELLSTGKVTIKENNQNITVDYGVPASHLNVKLVINDDTDVPAEFEKIVYMAAKSGITLNGIMTTKGVLSKLRGNKSMQIAINGANSVGARVNNSALSAYFSEEHGINRIITNDLTYGVHTGDDENGRPIVKQVRRFAEDTLTFFGTSSYVQKLGAGLWGIPPEVDVQNMLSVSQSDQAYVYITQWAEHDPSVLWTKASSLFMPALYSPNSLIITKVTSK